MKVHITSTSAQAGVKVIYCAGPFANDGSPASNIIKSIKRAMAGEFSRELPEKVFLGQSRQVERGFWQGSMPGYGLRRMLVDASHQPKGCLRFAEQTNIQTDRIVLVLVPPNEVASVRRFLFWYLHNKLGVGKHAARLNTSGIYNSLGHAHPLRTARFHPLGVPQNRLLHHMLATPSKVILLTPLRLCASVQCISSHCGNFLSKRKVTRMIQIQKILPTCFLFAVLVSFTTIASASAESDPEPPALETTIHTFTRCPVSGATGPTIGALPVFLVPILSAVISRGVDVTVDKAAKLVQDAASPKDFVLTPPAPITAPFYKITSSGDVQISQQINCVVVVRGRIGFSVIDPLANSLAGAPPLLRGIMTRFSASEPNGPHPARTAVAGKPTYHLIEPPEYYAEFALVTSDSGDKIALRPQVLYVGDFQSKDGLFGPSKRTYTTVINFSEVGSALPFLSAEFKYNNVARNESKLQCDGISSKLTCESAILGPERGWASTLARTGEITAAQQGRQKMASTLALAATPAPPKRPSFADEVPDARTSLIAYCNAISAQNKEKSSPQKFSSDACPVSITQTKRDYEYALVLAQYQIEKSKANDFRQKKCPGTAPFDNTAVVQCMNKLPELQEMDIGNFQISASISETRPGNKVAEFFVPVIDEVSPGIKTAIKEQIDPAERRRAKEAEEEKARTDASASRDAKVALKEAEIRVQIAQNDYEQALSNVEKNFSDSSAKNTLLEKKIALIQQQVAANNAARTVGQAVPYPDAE